MKTKFFFAQIVLLLFLLVLPLATSKAQVVGGSSSSKFCNELRKIPGGVVKCSADVQGVSFTDFKGELRAPSAEGYDKSLTRATTLRQFVLNIVRFVLGFLGLGAVVVVIYGGILYVSSAGNEEGATKGKNAIKYAVIGIIIILGSFALVNTLLQAGTGTDRASQLEGVAGNGDPSGSTASRRKTYEQAIESLNSTAQTVVAAYENYLSLQESINELRSIPIKTEAEVAVLTVDNIRRGIDTLNSRVDSLSALQTEIVFFKSDVFPKYEQEAFDGKLDKGDIAKSFAGTFIEGFSTANKADLKNKIKNSSQILSDAAKLVVDENAADGLSKKIKDGFLTIEKCLNSLAGQENDCRLGNAAFVKLLTDTSNQIALLSEVKFVEVKIGASTVKGGAPLFVRFDALETVDPSNQTIKPENFHWNLVGVKTSGSPSPIKDACVISGPSDNLCAAKNGAATVSAIYETPGRYRVSLTVISNEPDKFAAGRDFIDIVVEPPSSEIKIKAGPAGDAANRSDLETESVYQVGRLEGQEGIEFNASLSKGKGGATITQYKWNFGDGSPEIVQNVEASSGGGQPAGQAGIIVHKYLQEGSYRLLLEVTDQAGITDRKLMTVIVSSPTARIFFNRQDGEVGQEFILDGTNSGTDQGQIVGYEWKVTKEKTPCTAEKVIELREKNRERLTIVPEEPGIYTVNLIVTDSTARSNLATRKLYLASRQPRVELRFSNPNKYKPNQFLLDASASADPDRGDRLFYKFSGEGFKPLEKETVDLNSSPGVVMASFVEPQQLFVTDQPCKLSEYGSSEAVTKVVFAKKGKHKIAVRVTDEHGKFAVQEKELEVTSILDVDFQAANNLYAKNLDNNGRALFSFTAQSENASNFEWNFGDEFSNESTGINSKEATHTFTRAGVYNVKLKVLDSSGDSNSITKRIFVNDGKGPIALLRVSLNGTEIPELDDNSILTISRSDTLSFDAAGSLAPDGTSGLGKLRYIWSMGRRDNDLLKGPVIDAFHYEDLSPEGKPFEIKLLVESLAPTGVTGEADPQARKNLTERTLKVKVVPLPPRLGGIEAQPLGEKLETPLEVKLTAAGAEDPDGKITTYRWWYSEALKKGDNYIIDNKELDTQISIGPTTTMTINTHGSQNETHYYTFGVELTDNDNQTIRSDEILDKRLLPVVKIVNGPNDPPQARFTVNKTNVLAGEAVNLVSSSQDPDGTIISYIWDFEGNGFFDNEKNKTNVNPQLNQANVAFTFDKVNSDGIPVRLKVYDNNGASAVSEPVRIYVDSISTPPEAAFTYEISGDRKGTFTDNSQVDERTGLKIVKLAWDFDLARDADGNGVNDDDDEKASVEHGRQSAGKSVFVHEYPDYGIYRVRLNVTDSQGNQDSVTRFVNVEKKDGNTISGFSPKKLEARLISNPAPEVSDGRIHLKGQKATVSFDYKSSQGPIAIYSIDKNILFDTNGNGISDDDQDHLATAQEVSQGSRGTWSTEFEKKWGAITVRLTVFDKDGNRDHVDKQITFAEVSGPVAASGNSLSRYGSASIFHTLSGIVGNKGQGSSSAAGIALTTGFAILLAGSLLTFRKSKNKKTTKIKLWTK